MIACTMRQQHVRMTGPGGSSGGDQAPTEPVGVRSEPSEMLFGSTLLYTARANGSGLVQ